MWQTKTLPPVKKTITKQHLYSFLFFFFSRTYWKECEQLTKRVPVSTEDSGCMKPQTVCAFSDWGVQSNRAVRTLRDATIQQAVSVNPLSETYELSKLSGLSTEQTVWTVRSVRNQPSDLTLWDAWTQQTVRSLNWASCLNSSRCTNSQSCMYNLSKPVITIICSTVLEAIVVLL